MSGYRYRITVEPVSDNDDQNNQQPPLIFEVENHDNILEIEERLQTASTLNLNSKEEVSAFAIGLKLFSETMLKNRKNPIFEPLQDGFKAFMKGLKGQAKKDA